MIRSSMMEAHWKWWMHEVHVELFLYDWMFEGYAMVHLK